MSRRFSEFEKLLASLRSDNSFVIPELPKKRYYNNSESVIELRRAELETFLRTILRNRDLKESPTLIYFLTKQEGLDEFLGNVSRYGWAFSLMS